MAKENNQSYIMYSLILLLVFNPCFSSATQVILTGQSLTGNQTLTSKGGIFELGFFKPGKSPNYYLGIWYKQIRVQTVVWVANREVPLLNTSSELKLSEDGNLLLFNPFKILVWSTNSSTSSQGSTVAVLLDTGNLVLRDMMNSSIVIWDSFNHPTDTFLPHGRLGRNKITGEVQRLYSWKNQDNPALGAFINELDSKRKQLHFLWNRSHSYWASGDWNGLIFRNLPEMISKNLIDHHYISNEMEDYFSYWLQNSSLLTRFTIDAYGQGRQFLWSDSNQDWILLWYHSYEPCGIYSVCSGSLGSCNMEMTPICRCLHGFEPISPKDWNLSDWSGGCRRKTPLQCGNKEDGDKFLVMASVQLPTNSKSLALGSAKECELACLQTCSCSAYSYAAAAAQCLIWSGGLSNIKVRTDGTDDGSGGDIYIRIAASEMPASKAEKKLPYLVILIAAAVSGFLGVALLQTWRWLRGKLMDTSWLSQEFFGPFRYRELQVATKNFSKVLGSGSFGSVYKGALSHSTLVAVKVLEGFRQGEKEFRAEVSILGQLQHVNLVRLRGFCCDGTRRLLVYDHMPKGSLDIHLFGKNSQLDWETRYKIALGIAKGLAYLHDKCRDCIIHCDIKPENILLDINFCPKIADFGLAKLVGRDFSRVLTSMRGTRGYLAPEWIYGLPITSKADTYSYGMMLFEIISGKRNLAQPEDGCFEYFPICVARKLHDVEEILSLLDYKTKEIPRVQELQRACNVACWCIQDDEKKRPSMGLVVQYLEGALQPSTPPIPLDLQNLVENLEHQDSSFSEN